MTDHVTRTLKEWISPAEEATIELGRRLGRACRGGEVILLEGPLGAGKTCLAGGLAEGLEINEPAVSPTYVIMRSYTGERGLTLHHLDFYRLGGDEDLDTIGLEDCFGQDSVVLIEWPSRCPAAMREFTLLLELEPAGETARRIRATLGPLATPESGLATVCLTPSPPVA
jgi:tRNA threonylcarbamoyladenosine biosynthesis protein TsaE